MGIAQMIGNKFLLRLNSVFNDYILRGNPFVGGHRATSGSLRRGYRQEPPFSDLLPWLDIPADGEIVLEDGRSCGAVIELSAVDVEGRSEEYIENLRDSLADALAETFEEHARAPWILQIYSFMDQSGLLTDWRDCVNASDERAISSRWGQHMSQLMGEHMSSLSRSSGKFIDPLSGLCWRGNRRRIIACLYRRATGATLAENRRQLADAVKRFRTQLSSVAVSSSLCSGAVIRNWLHSWFNPSGHGKMPDDPPVRPMSGRRFDYTLADAVCSADIRSDAEQGCWYLDGVPHRILALQCLRGVPLPGQLSAERLKGETLSCMLEQLPPDTVVAFTLVFSHQEMIHTHLDRIANSAIGQSQAAMTTRASVSSARERMIAGDKVFPFTLAVFVRGKNQDQLNDRCLAIDNLFQTNRLQLIPIRQDPVALDSWLRHLPMAYRYSLDQVRRRNRLIYISDLAALLPLYGRARGSGLPGLTFYNRGGELFSCSPLNIADRSHNAHLFVFGPTGSGKSATLVYLQMLAMACLRPRIVAVETGNSYGLLTRYLESYGITTKDIVLRPGCGTTLPPFAMASQLVDSQSAQSGTAPQTSRDLLSEMVLIARLMVTGGRKDEEKRFSRADEASLQQAIISAARRLDRRDGQCVGVSDVCESLRMAGEAIAGNDSGRQRRYEMAEAMSLFTTGFAGEIFDSGGSPWPDVDYMRIELGTFAGEQHRDQLSVAWLGLINAVMASAEKNQHDWRPTILLTDEAHVITTNPLLAGYVVRISKLLGRRLGLWLWMATQNIRDFQGEAEKMLAMFEWWLCLQPGVSELRELCRFRNLDKEVQEMMLSTRKFPGLYTEGVMLAERFQGRFRNVPPPLCLALAQTEKEEKAERARLMAAHECDEISAALMVAEKLATDGSDR